MRSLIASLLLLFPSLLFAQQRVNVPHKASTQAVYEESTLEVGQHIVFDFTPSDGSKAFGGKPYKIECESRDTGDIATFWRGKVEQDNGELRDQAIIFAGNESPDVMTVRVLVDNKTVYRHNITVDKRKPAPGPSPYLDVISKGFAADGGKKEQAAAHALVYKIALGKVPSFVDGKACWDWIAIEYQRIAPLVQTRQAIANILYETTRQYYDSKLTAAERKVFARVLGDIQKALDALQSDAPPVDPVVPVGPKKLFVVVVEETGSAANNRSAWFNSADLVNKIKNSGHKYRIVEKDTRGPDGQAPADVAPYIALASKSGKSLPYLFLVDQATGKVYYQDTLPKLPAELVALLTKIGG